jgi:hypothetical protein
LKLHAAGLARFAVLGLENRPVLIRNGNTNALFSVDRAILGGIEKEAGHNYSGNKLDGKDDKEDQYGPIARGDHFRSRRHRVPIQS